MAKAIGAIPPNWQQFILSVLFIVVVPLAVLVLDLFIKHEIPDQDLYLTFAIYFIATGAASRSQAILGISIVLAGAYFVAYGVSAATPENCPSVPPQYTALGYLARYLSPVLFTGICGIERYNRHVADNELFWDFT